MFEAIPSSRRPLAPSSCSLHCILMIEQTGILDNLILFRIVLC